MSSVTSGRFATKDGSTKTAAEASWLESAPRLVACSVADQAAVSLSNFVLLMLLARHATAAEFGALSLVYGWWIVVLVAGRGLAGEQLLSTLDLKSLRRIIGLLLIFVVIVGVATLSLIFSGLIPSWLLIYVTLLASSMPFLMLLDLVRLAALARGYPMSALGYSLAWAAAWPSIMLVLGWAGFSGMLVVWVSWLCGGVFASLFGIRTLKRTGVGIPFRAEVTRGAQLAVEGSLQRLAIQVALQMALVVSSLAAVGRFRFMISLFGPVAALAVGLQGSMTAVARASTRRKLALYVVEGPWILTSLMAVFVGVFLIALPDVWFASLFGSTQERNVSLILLTGVLLILQVGVSRGRSKMRGHGGARRVLMIRLAVSPWIVAMVVGGFALGGTVGGMAMWVVSNALVVVLNGIFGSDRT